MPSPPLSALETIVVVWFRWIYILPGSPTYRIRSANSGVRAVMFSPLPDVFCLHTALIAGEALEWVGGWQVSVSQSVQGDEHGTWAFGLGLLPNLRATEASPLLVCRSWANARWWLLFRKGSSQIQEASGLDVFLLNFPFFFSSWVCICGLCVYMFTHMDAYVCAHSCGGPEMMSGLFLDSSQPGSLRTGPLNQTQSMPIP